MRMQSNESTPTSKGREFRTFLFLAVILAPALAVITVGGLGLAIWIFQMIAGPPGPPAV